MRPCNKQLYFHCFTLCLQYNNFLNIWCNLHINKHAFNDRTTKYKPTFEGINVDFLVTYYFLAFLKGINQNCLAAIFPKRIQSCDTVISEAMHCFRVYSLHLVLFLYACNVIQLFALSNAFWGFIDAKKLHQYKIQLCGILWWLSCLQ